MPEYVMARTAYGLNEHGKAIRNAKILVLGIAYKPDVDDVRETPAAEIIKLLVAAGAKVSYHDPHVPVFSGMRKYSHDMRSVTLDAEQISGADCVLVVTHHRKIDFKLVAEHARLIVDTRNVMAAHAPIRGLLVPS